MFASQILVKQAKIGPEFIFSSHSLKSSLLVYLWVAYDDSLEQCLNY